MQYWIITYLDYCSRRDYNSLYVLFCDLDTVKSTFVISGEPEVTPEVKLMMATLSHFAPYRMVLVAETGFRTRNKDYI